MDLLLKLDSIQDSDSMIRDGKRSVTRELVRFLDFIDGVSARRHQLRNKPIRNMRTAQNASKSRVLTGRGRVSKARNGILVKRHELEPRVKKSVSFAENRNLSRVLGSTHEPVSGEDGPSMGQTELVENLSGENVIQSISANILFVSRAHEGSLTKN
ncbi:unnamed protein product, partial [Vitis vinifera]